MEVLSMAKKPIPTAKEKSNKTVILDLIAERTGSTRKQVTMRYRYRSIRGSRASP